MGATKQEGAGEQVKSRSRNRRGCGGGGGGRTSLSYAEGVAQKVLR